MNASNDQNQPTEKTVEQINEHSSSNLVNFGSSLKNSTPQLTKNVFIIVAWIVMFFEILISLMCMKQMTCFPEVVS